MRRLLFLLLLAAPLNAQTIQKIHCGGTAACTLPAVKAGDTLIAVADTSTAPADRQGDVFLQVGLQGWYGNYVNLSYALNVSGGDTTISFGTPATSVYFAEYPPATFDQASADTWLCCAPDARVGPLNTAQPNELLIFWTAFDTGVATSRAASAGFTVQDTGTDLTVQDALVPPGTYSATVLQGQNASGSKLAAFVLTAPPASLTYVLPGCCTLTFPIVNGSQVPGCSAADGTCSISIQVCDAAIPPNCLTSQSGQVWLVRTVTLPVPQTQMIPVVMAKSP